MALNEQMFMFAQTAVSNKDQKRFTPTGANQSMTVNDFSRQSQLRVSDGNRPKSASGCDKKVS